MYMPDQGSIVIFNFDLSAVNQMLALLGMPSLIFAGDVFAIQGVHLFDALA